jgi:maleamate amidohydrolase
MSDRLTICLSDSRVARDMPPTSVHPRPPWDDVIPPSEQAEYERGGWGGSVGFGERPALLVVDMYNAFVDRAYPFAAADAPATADRIAVLLGEFRRRRLPVFFSTTRREPTAASRGRWKVTGTRAPIMQSDEAYEICPQLAPRPDEYVFVKTYPSMFAGTTLVSQLIYHRVDTVVVTGTVTSGCVRGTCLDAFSHNYIVNVPLECVCDRGAVSHKVALFEIEMKYGDVVPLQTVLDRVAGS